MEVWSVTFNCFQFNALDLLSVWNDLSSAIQNIPYIKLFKHTYLNEQHINI